MNCRFSCDKDKEMFNKILQYNLRLLCGNDQEKINRIGNIICNAINTVKTVPNGPDEYLDSKRLNGETTSNGLGISDIYMKGYSNAPAFKYNQIKHTFSHELWHAIYAIMNRGKDRCDAKGNRIIWIGKINGKNYFGAGGTIAERETGKRYGKLFEETMMDIKASISLNEFDTERKISNSGITANTILSEHIDKWSSNDQSGYAIFSSITRLMIAAYANEPNVDYHYWIQQGEAIDDMRTRKSNGTIMYVNDFLYGMMYDPIHIMEEYDKYMGEGEYLNLLKITDTIYEQGLTLNKTIDSNLVKQVMKNISQFANFRTRHLKQKGIFSNDEIRSLYGNYNKIWNYMQKEYGVYFSKDEIRN